MSAIGTGAEMALELSVLASPTPKIAHPKKRLRGLNFGSRSSTKSASFDGGYLDRLDE